MEELYGKLSARLGRETADAIFKILVHEFWGRRITIPRMEYLSRRDRNRKIKEFFHRSSQDSRYRYEETGIRFGLSVTQVRRIVHGG